MRPPIYEDVDFKELGAAPIFDNAIDPGRPIELELALEYSINRADGRNFALEGSAIVEPDMVAARALIPWVKWKWREYMMESFPAMPVSASCGKPTDFSYWPRLDVDL